MAERRDDAAAAGAPQLKLAKTEDVVVTSIPLALAAKRAWEFPAMVPMENIFLGDRYYVRECYPEYYRLVMDMLSERRGVTVTGTPGIGKSVFMAYFFERYSKDHPNATAIMLSYNYESKLRRVVVSRGGVELEEEYITQTRMEDTARTYINEALSDGTDDAIMLIDGPPATIPEKLRWVSFTSPNEKWLRQIRKSSHALYKVYMPTWTLEELHDAAKLLDNKNLKSATDDDLRVLKMDLTTEPTPRRPLIDVCFDVFGGVPRSCFANRRELTNQYGSLLGAIDSLTLEQVWKALNEESAADDSVKRVHLILHYEPQDELEDGLKEEDDNFRHQDAIIRPGSLMIKWYILNHENEIMDNQQKALMNMLDAAPEARAFLGYLYEIRAYRQLFRGCTIKAGRVRGQEAEGNSPLSLSISEQCSVGWITNTFSTEPFDRTKSHLVIPESKNLESIDGFYWHAEGGSFRVVLFQVTVSKRHPVKARGLIKVFQELEVWETVQKNPQLAALVFVVPEKRVENFIATPQRIAAGIRVEDASSVGFIHDIGEARTDLLASCGVSAVGQLKGYEKFADITKIPAATKKTKAEHAFYLAKKRLEQYESEECSGSEMEKSLQSIPQYVWGL